MPKRRRTRTRAYALVESLLVWSARLALAAAWFALKAGGLALAAFVPTLLMLAAGAFVLPGLPDDWQRPLANVGTVLILANAAAVMAVYLTVLALRFIEHLLFPKLNFEAALRGRNVAVAIVVAGAVAPLVLGIFLLAGKALAAPSDAYDDAFRQHARLNFGLRYHWSWFKAQGMTESGLDPARCSQAGACGVMQFMPGTAVAFGLQDRFNARESIRAGIAYDRQLWAGFAPRREDVDSLAFAFAAYNWGPGNVQRVGLPCARARSGGDATWAHLAPCLPLETRDYYPRIARWRERFGRGG